MITIKVRRTGEHCTGFTCSGHAGYAQEGYDIVCAGVSALAVSAANGIEAFTQDAVTIEGGDDGYLKCLLGDPQEASEGALAILDTFALGLDMILQNYGDDFLQIQVQEDPMN